MKIIKTFEEFVNESKKYEYSYKEIKSFLLDIIKYMNFKDNKSNIYIPSDRNSENIVSDGKKALILLDKFYKIMKNENPVFYIWTAGFSDNLLNRKIKSEYQRIDINNLYKIAKENPGKLEYFKIGFDSEKQTMFGKEMGLGKYGSLD